MQLSNWWRSKPGGHNRAVGGPDHFDYFDGWRGLAITLLLIGHFLPVPGLNLGAVGVSLFFVLSGYFMAQLLFVKQTGLPTFYRRRISRILPAHLFFIVAVSVFYGATGRTVDWGETLAALFFLNNYFPGEPGNASMPFGNIWSLAVEEHSYLLLSVVALLVRQRGLSAKWMISILAVCFSAMGFWYWAHYDGRTLDFGKWLHTEVSAYGIFASAAILLWLGGRRPAMSVAVFLLLMSAGLLLHWWSVPGPVRTTVGVGMFALAVNLLPNAASPIKYLLAIRPLRYMGLWSFSLYLWQQPFYLATHHGLIPLYWAIPLALACGIASYYLLENPLRLYLNRVWGAPRARHLGLQG
ncbi:acyltransferase family protein [Chitinimonas naiadis]